MNKTKISVVRIAIGVVVFFVALFLFFSIKHYYKYRYPIEDFDKCIEMLKAPYTDASDFIVRDYNGLPLSCSVYSLMKMGPSVVPRLINEYNNMDKERLNPFQVGILRALILIEDKPSFDFVASIIESKVYCSDAIRNFVYLVALGKPIPKNVLSVLIEKTTSKNEDVLYEVKTMLVSSIDMPEDVMSINRELKGPEIQKWYSENKDKLYWDDEKHIYRVK